MVTTLVTILVCRCNRRRSGVTRRFWVAPRPPFCYRKVSPLSCAWQYHLQITPAPEIAIFSDRYGYIFWNGDGPVRKPISTPPSRWLYSRAARTIRYSSLITLHCTYTHPLVKTTHSQLYLCTPNEVRRCPSSLPPLHGTLRCVDFFGPACAHTFNQLMNDLISTLSNC